MTTAHTTGPELTRNPQTGTFGFMCVEHHVLRSGLTQTHAANVEAKHLREHHDPMAHLLANLTIDLTHAAMYAAAAYSEPEKPRKVVGYEAIAMWEALVGLPSEEARALAAYLIGTQTHHTAAVTPW